MILSSRRSNDGEVAHVKHSTMAELKEWAEFNNLVLGTPELGTSYFSVEHKDGSPLTEEERERLAASANLEEYQARTQEGLRSANLPCSDPVHPRSGKVTGQILHAMGELKAK